MSFAIAGMVGFGLLLIFMGVIVVLNKSGRKAKGKQVAEQPLSAAEQEFEYTLSVANAELRKRLQEKKTRQALAEAVELMSDSPATPAAK